MSAEELSRLSLGDNMVTTRAGAARARTAPLGSASTSSQHARQRSASAQQQSPSSTQLSSPTPSLIESKSQLQYDVSSFDEDLRRQAKRGLMNVDEAINMKYCMEDDEHPEYIFHIDEELTITMGRYDAPYCSCGANDNKRACRHIFWVEDKIMTGAPNNIKAQTLALSEDGATIQNMAPAEMIDKMGLENVADGLGWVMQEDELPEEDHIKDKITEMLSVFEPANELPSEFKVPDSPDSPDPSERSRKYREFKDLFTEHAIRDHGLFIQLKEIIDPEFQAHTVFDKIDDRIVRTFQALDEYITNGPTTGPSEALDVTTCAAKLKALVQAIDEYYHQQEENGADLKDVAIRAAAALIHILGGVVDRDSDAYANITWGALPPASTEESNLFECLIRAPAPSDGLFVLDTLQALPQEDVLRNHGEVLLSMGDKLARTWAPSAYTTAFRAITQESRKRAASEAGGSDAKRAMQ